MKATIVLCLFGLSAVILVTAAPQITLEGTIDVESAEEAAAVASFSANCPASNGEQLSLVANPNDCGSYYVCDTGIPVIMQCPGGLHFNVAEKVCDWPINACCDSTYDVYHRCAVTSRVRALKAKLARAK
ncbi:hypothetical protein TKK_0007382 [Trichogramma kaykai]